MEIGMEIAMEIAMEIGMEIAMENDTNTYLVAPRSDLSKIRGRFVEGSWKVRVS